MFKTCQIQYRLRASIYRILFNLLKTLCIGLRFSHTNIRFIFLVTLFAPSTCHLFYSAKREALLIWNNFFFSSFIFPCSIIFFFFIFTKHQETQWERGFKNWSWHTCSMYVFYISVQTHISIQSHVKYEKKKK